LLILGKEQKIIHIADVGLAFQFALDEVVEGVEVDIRPELGSQMGATLKL